MQQPDITGVQNKNRKKWIATLAQTQSPGVDAYGQAASFLLCTGQCFHTNITGEKESSSNTAIEQRLRFTTCKSIRLEHERWCVTLLSVQCLLSEIGWCWESCQLYTNHDWANTAPQAMLRSWLQTQLPAISGTQSLRLTHLVPCNTVSHNLFNPFTQANHSRFFQHVSSKLSLRKSFSQGGKPPRSPDQFIK